VIAILCLYNRSDLNTTLDLEIENDLTFQVLKEHENKINELQTQKEALIQAIIILDKRLREVETGGMGVSDSRSH